jgi:hypothetical protein
VEEQIRRVEEPIYEPPLLFYLAIPPQNLRVDQKWARTCSLPNLPILAAPHDLSWGTTWDDDKGSDHSIHSELVTELCRGLVTLHI